MALPVTEVHAIRPPALPRDYHKLSEGAKHCKAVFRVWETTSASPLVFTGYQDNSGFLAPIENLAPLFPDGYLKVYKPFIGGIEWAEGSYMKQSAVDHILQRYRQTALYHPGMVMNQPGYDIPPDEESPWISTTKNLFWCVWDIARRLALALHPLPHVDSDNPYDQSLPMSNRDHKVHLALIRHHFGTIGLSDARRGHLELLMNPSGPASRIDRDQMSVSAQKDYDTARRLAIMMDEVLYFGRIFAQNIDSSPKFTVDHLPFPLPEESYRRRTARSASPASDDSDRLLGWLDDLVWEPGQGYSRTSEEINGLWASQALLFGQGPTISNRPLPVGARQPELVRHIVQ